MNCNLPWSPSVWAPDASSQSEVLRRMEANTIAIVWCEPNRCLAVPIKQQGCSVSTTKSVTPADKIGRFNRKMREKCVYFASRHTAGDVTCTSGRSSVPTLLVPLFSPRNDTAILHTPTSPHKNQTWHSKHHPRISSSLAALGALAEQCRACFSKLDIMFISGIGFHSRVIMDLC